MNDLICGIDTTVVEISGEVSDLIIQFVIFILKFRLYSIQFLLQKS